MVPPTAAEQCPFQGALEMLGKRHTLAILWTLQQRAPRRFNGLRDAAGINPVTLSNRLGELEARGILYRKAYNEAPPRVEYGLTEKGEGLLAVLDELAAWAEDYDEAQDVARDGPPESPSARTR